MKAFTYGLGILIIAVGLLAFFTWDDFYTDKISFQSEQEYSAFKEAVADPLVRIDDIIVLSSSPPIIVDFSIYTTQGHMFPYGQRSTSFGTAIFLIAIGFAFITAITIIDIIARNRSSNIKDS